MPLENYLLRLALRENYDNLRKEILAAHTPKERQRIVSTVPHLELAIWTLGSIIMDDGGDEKYENALKFVATIQLQLSGGYDEKMENLFRTIEYYLKLLVLLTNLGKVAIKEVTNLLNEYFPSSYSPDSTVSDAFAAANYPVVRKTILKAVSHEHQAQLASNLSPKDPRAIVTKLRESYEKIARGMSASFEPLELLTPIKKLSHADRDDPAIILYYETVRTKFNSTDVDESTTPNDRRRPKIVVPAEKDLIDFVRGLRNSQTFPLSFPENLLLPTPDSMSIPRSEPETSQETLHSFIQDRRNGLKIRTRDRSPEIPVVELSDSEDEQQALAKNLKAHGVTKVFDVNGKAIRKDRLSPSLFDAVEVDVYESEVIEKDEVTGLCKRTKNVVIA